MAEYLYTKIEVYPRTGEMRRADYFMTPDHGLCRFWGAADLDVEQCRKLSVALAQRVKISSARSQKPRQTSPASSSPSPSASTPDASKRADSDSGEKGTSVMTTEAMENPLKFLIVDTMGRKTVIEEHKAHMIWLWLNDLMNGDIIVPEERLDYSVQWVKGNELDRFKGRKLPDGT